MKLLYFSWVRERIGRDEEDLALPAGVATVGALLDWLATRGPGYAAALADRRAIRVAVNQDYADESHPLAPHDEVALFPPVTGG
ncbi:molybdopterin converting factor subunit 1 [Pedomonas sp. V897]|mgnify:CR=1 FL=1|uniref:molybdopterin converting factor subunit 1 n=1 Tax=Pedomonas sp. V897 TaxID=3446482 RepID=UPI003EDFDFAD